MNSANIDTNGATPKTYGNAVVLYLPAAIQISDAAVYDNVSLGAIGAVTSSAIENGANVGQAMFSGVADEISSLVDGIVGGMSTPTAKLAAVRAAQKFGSAGIVGGVQSATRVTTNPNIRAIFNQVPLREFAFTFKLIANSPGEALEIKKIIKFFRKELYPQNIPVNVGSERLSLGYHFPDQFRIEFHHPAENLVEGEWSPSQVATKLKDCYLHGFNAVYNSTSMGMHADGNFTEIDISLSFREAATLTKDDIDEGY